MKLNAPFHLVLTLTIHEAAPQLLLCFHSVVLYIYDTGRENMSVPVDD
jgi:hypothetical protein